MRTIFDYNRKESITNSHKIIMKQGKRVVSVLLDLKLELIKDDDVVLRT